MTAIIVGRFQVPYLHLGHIWLISSCLQRFGNVVVVLGVSDIRDEKNPFSLGHRTDIIHRIFEGIVIRQLFDIPGDNETWSMRLDSVLEEFHDPILCHSRDSFKNSYKGELPLYEIEELKGFSGTELRKQMEI